MEAQDPVPNAAPSHTAPAPPSTVPSTNPDSSPPRTRSPSHSRSSSSSSSPSPARERSPSPAPATIHSSSPKAPAESTPNPIISSTIDSTPPPSTDSTPPPSINSTPAPVPSRSPDSPQAHAVDSSPAPTPAPAMDSAPAPTPNPVVVHQSESPPAPAPAPAPAQPREAPESHSSQARSFDPVPDSTKAPAVDSTPEARVPAPDSTPALASATTTVAPEGVDVEVDLAPEKIEEEDNSPSFHCTLYDTEVAYKIAQALLPGLASACVDNTTGGIFKTPASIAVEMRKEMVDYLTQRSESFVAETLILEENLAEEVSDHPYDIVANFVDDFDVLKRNWFSRVSGWLLSDRREDRIDDLIQEMELNKFWDIERREAISQNLLKNVDFKNEFHCDTKFKTEQGLEEHVQSCRFRTMICNNEGCYVKFMAGHLEQHELICPFKIISCEQGCSAQMMRREMDKHCITVCPMKLVNCRFYQVGCKSRVPQLKIENHLRESIHDHILCVLRSTRKEASEENLKGLVQQLVESPFRGQLEEANNARALMAAIKDVEAKIEPTEVYAVNASTGDHAPAADAKENNTGTN